MASLIPTTASPTGLKRNLEIVRLQTKRQAQILNVLQEELESKMEEVQELKIDLNMVDPVEITSYNKPTSRAPSLSPRTSFSPDRGTTVEYRMISDLRNQLESQAAENRKLRQQIEAATVKQTHSFTDLTAPLAPTSPSETVYRSVSDSRLSTLPRITETVESILARGSRRSPIGNVPLPTESATEVLLRKQLSDAQAEITLLNEKLRQSESGHSQQRVQFRSAIEDLQARLNETIVGRDSVLELRKRESEGQEKMIAQLQQSVKDLDTANRQHEKAMRDAGHRINSLQKAVDASASALQHIHSLVWSRDRLPGPAVHRLDDGARPPPPNLIVRLVEDSLKEKAKRIEELERDSAEVKKDLAETKKEAEVKTRLLAEEHREKLLQLSGDQEKQLEALTQRAANARQQAAGLQAQLTDLQDQSSKQIALRTMELTTLESQYEALKKEMEAERKEARHKIESMTNELDTNRANMQAAREEISNLQLTLANANINLQTNKEKLLALQSQLREEEEKTEELRSQEGQRLTNMQRELEDRSLEVRHMEEILVSYKEQAQSQLQQKMFEVQCEEQKKAVENSSKLLQQIESLQAENSKLSLEILKKTSDCDQSEQSRDRLSSVLEETTSQFQAAQATNDDLSRQLEEKSKMVTILMQERDHYQALCEERVKELDSATSLQSRLQAQLKEKEVQYEELCKQRVSLSQVVESNERTSAEARQERESLIKLLDDKNTELQEVKGVKDDLNRKLKVREKRVQSLETEVKTLTGAVEEKNREVEAVIEGKAGILEELKTVQEKVMHLTAEKEVLETRYVELEKTTDKSSGHLQLRIQALEHDLQLTLEALRATKSADARAVDVADNVQKELLSKRSEVDSLQNKSHWLEESLSAAKKENSVLCAEKELLEDQLSRLTSQLERLQLKLKSLANRRSSQKDIVSKLESALEKAALKHTDAQRVIEEQEQALTKMTLKHQLEMKALQRTRASKEASQHIPSKPLSENPDAVEKRCRRTESATATALAQVKSSSTGGEGKASAGLVSAHFLQSASIQAVDRLSGRNYITPVPVVIMNASTEADGHAQKLDKSDSSDPDHNMSAEMKDLLQEMRSVFTSNMAALKSATAAAGQPALAAGSGLDKKLQSGFGSAKEVPTLDRLNGLLGQKDPVILARDTQSAPEVGSLSSTKEVCEIDPPLLTSSPFKIDESISAPIKQGQPQDAGTPPRQKLLHPRKGLQLDAPPSPVTNLLGLHAGVRSEPNFNPGSGLSLNRPHGQSAERHAKKDQIGNRGSVNASTRSASKHTTKHHVRNGLRKDAYVSTTQYKTKNAKSHAGDNFDLSDSSISATEDGFHAPTRGKKDFSTPLTIQVPDPMDTVHRRMNRNRQEQWSSAVRDKNSRNREGFGDVNAAEELIISDSEESSITTVTSVSSVSPKTDTAATESGNLQSLHARLAALSQMGSQLQKGNKEMARLIRRQDFKLKMCRQEESQAQRIIKSK
ncbi:uncharacterized protein [Diadema setosum]|uniref:uncharacterized protein n=1 Tax=Diadema setosum TaxID=31175 RepID=UPI003B3BA3AA